MAPAQARGDVVPDGALQRCHRHYQSWTPAMELFVPAAVATKPELNAAASQNQAAHATEGSQLGEAARHHGRRVRSLGSAHEGAAVAPWPSPWRAR